MAYPTFKEGKSIEPGNQHLKSPKLQWTLRLLEAA